MTTDFEYELREALHREAARAPQLADDWTPEPSIDLESPSRSRWVLATAACLIVVAGVAGIIVTAQTDPPVPASVSGTNPDTGNGPDELEAPTTQAVVVPPSPTDQVPTSVDSMTRFGTSGLAIGDSRMLGAVQDLRRLGLTVDAMESRQFADVVGIVQRLSDSDHLQEVVVVDLGNNGSIQQADLDTLMEQLRDVARVVMLTTPIERDWVQPNNALIMGLPAIYPNVTVIDFATKAAECPGDCFAADNLHVTPDGARYYANLIAEAAGLEPMQQGAPTTSTDVTTTSLPVTETTVVPSTRRLTGQEIPDWFGTFTMEPQTVDAVLGTTGTATYTLATTPSSFCIRTDTGSGCSFTGDGSNLFDQPMSLPFIGSNIETSGRWTLHVLAPLDVQLRLISNTTPPCELQPFTLRPYAEVALWACESTSPVPMWYTLQGVRGDDTIVIDQFSSGKPDVQTGEQMLEEMFGAKCLEGASDQPVNFVPRTIDLEHIPSPVEDTGARIGPVAGQDIPARHPSEAEYWISVGIGDEIVGYSYVPNGELNVAPEQLDSDCHPEVAIYNERGELIGGFYNSVPAIIDRI